MATAVENLTFFWIAFEVARCFSEERFSFQVRQMGKIKYSLVLIALLSIKPLLPANEAIGSRTKEVWYNRQIDIDKILLVITPNQTCLTIVNRLLFWEKINTASSLILCCGGSKVTVQIQSQRIALWTFLVLIGPIKCNSFSCMLFNSHLHFLCDLSDSKFKYIEPNLLYNESLTTKFK